MQNILIIGGSGFIGKNLVEMLSDEGHKIVLLTRNRNFDEFIDNPGIKIFHVALKDIDIIQNIVIENDIHVVIHLASNLIPISNRDQFDQEIQDIVLPTFELLNFISQKSLKIIYFSSGGAIYGDGLSEKTVESCDLAPLTYYGYSKLMIENYIQYLNRTTQLRFVILRPSNVFGKYQRLESNQGFIAVALGKILSNQAVEIWGDGKNMRDYIDVKDVVQVVSSVLKENIENEVFNVGSGISHSLLKVLDIIGKNVKRPIKVKFKEKRGVDLDSVSLEIAKLKTQIAFTPKTLDEGIKNLTSYIETLKNYDK